MSIEYISSESAAFENSTALGIDNKGTGNNTCAQEQQMASNEEHAIS